MNWKKWLGLAVFIALIFGAYRVSLLTNALSLPNSEEEIAAVREIVDRQNEDAFYRPIRKSLEAQAANPLKNVYFGDLHVHTNISSDAYLFGNRLDMDTAYRIAKGESQKTRTGERMELTRPLDFAALTDHAEGFGRRIACDGPDLSEAGTKQCEERSTPSLIGFLKMRSNAEQRPMIRDLAVFNEDSVVERDYAQRKPGSKFRMLPIVIMSQAHSPPLLPMSIHQPCQTVASTIAILFSDPWTYPNMRCQVLMPCLKLNSGRTLKLPVRMTVSF